MSKGRHGSVQRWCDCDHHHHHGARIKGAGGADPAALLPLVPVLMSYMLSFVFLGIYWNNHHHLLQAIKHVDGRVLWANLHLLFWLSLVPFVTGWARINSQQCPLRCIVS